ncbi:MAG: SEL1-like repeat protein, partial [Pseudomonadota bacterium]
NIKAMHNLAVLYAGQSGGTPDYVRAAQWFERAAKLNLADSQFNVAILFLNGLGVQKDLLAAYRWFALASEQGDEEAGRRLKGVERLLSAADLRKAKASVKAWRPEPANDAANKTTVWRPKTAGNTPAATPAAATSAASVTPAPSQPDAASPYAGLSNADRIKTAQRLLNGLGFNAGRPDGKIGDTTRTAIKTFQSQNGMIPTGRVDDALLDRIEGAAREKAAKLGRL